MAKCFRCGKEIPENDIFQVGDKSFCNEQCSHEPDEIKTNDVVKSVKAENGARSKSVTGQTAVIFGIIVVLIVAAVIKQLTTGSNSGLRKFISPDKSFSVMLPGDVQEKKVAVKSDVGPLEIFTYSAKSEYHDYTIIYVDYPHFLVVEMKPGKLLDGAIDGVAIDVGGKLMKETVIDLQGNPGRELKIAGMNKEIIKIHLFLVGDRLYQLKIVSKPEHAVDKNIDIVIDSFKLKSNQETKI